MSRIIGSSARRMQRLGSLKYLVSKGSTQRPSTAASIGANLLRAVSQKFGMEIQPATQQYCNKVFSEQHYSSLRAQIQKALRQQPPGKFDLELQDIYLSQDILPSKRGRILAEKEKDIHIFPVLANNLGLFSSDTYVLTSRGRLFMETISPAEIDAFNQISTVNPMVISFRQTLVLLYSFLEADGELVKKLYPIIARKENGFTDYET